MSQIAGSFYLLQMLRGWGTSLSHIGESEESNCLIDFKYALIRIEKSKGNSRRRTETEVINLKANLF